MFHRIGFDLGGFVLRVCHKSCKLQPSYETTESCHDVFSRMLVAANTWSGPKNVPDPLAMLLPEKLDGISNCLGMDNPDRGTLNWGKLDRVE